MESTYITSAQKANQLPYFELPEVAFIGRSNSGKSSLINGLANKKNLARQSAMPGRTQMVNFFELKRSQTEKIILADLPGYGFSVARKEIRKLWDDLLSTYLERANIRYFCCLFDSRRTIEDYEWEFCAQLGLKKPLLIIMTKIDKLSASEVKIQQENIKKQLSELNITIAGIYSVSNLKKTGLDELRDRIFNSLPK